ncbi:hypothetical protein ABVK25_010430 [Lepraria finkii]|uniref:Uncharacterized protein n=1 Tax=Lepraria finkii TaxID=1340010 RepID=A0ABR4AUG7_9LECA
MLKRSNFSPLPMPYTSLLNPIKFPIPIPVSITDYQTAVFGSCTVLSSSSEYAISLAILALVLGSATFLNFVSDYSKSHLAPAFSSATLLSSASENSMSLLAPALGSATLNSSSKYNPASGRATGAVTAMVTVAMAEKTLS